MKLLLAFMLMTVSTMAGTVSDATLGYTITLPTNWVQIKSKANQHYFRDSTKQYKSQISIVLYSIDQVSYPTPVDWTQAQFIAYKVGVETSAFPYGTVSYFDSSSAQILGSYWAPEAFSILYPGDSTPTYSEYMRYCAGGNFGYEIYAIGDSTDMINHVDFYAGIISSLQFTAPTVSIQSLDTHVLHEGGTRLSSTQIDLLGRRMPLLRGVVPSSYRPKSYLIRLPENRY